MTTLRGFAAGTLVLIGMEVLSNNTEAAGGLLGGAYNLFQAFLSPDVPALHYKGNWPSQSQNATTAGTSGATPVTGSLGPAHATVVAGTQTAPTINTGVLPA